MPRNSSGVYSLPAGNPVVTATTIAITWANSTLSDLAAEVTNSLDRAGRGSMTAPLLLADGSDTNPGIAFNAEAGTGFARDSAGVLGVSILGVNVGSFQADGYHGKVAGAADTYTPTISGQTNCSGVSVVAARYSQQGNIVTVSGTFQGTATTSGSNSFFDITIPVSSSFSGHNASGVVVGKNASGYLSAVVPNLLQIQWLPVDTNADVFMFVGQYEVV